MILREFSCKVLVIDPFNLEHWQICFYHQCNHGFEQGALPSREPTVHQLSETTYGFVRESMIRNPPAEADTHGFPWFPNENRLISCPLQSHHPEAQ